MWKWYCRFAAAMVCLAMAGCVQQAPTITPAGAAAQVQTGRALLTCRDACLDEWRRTQPQAAQFEAAARWPELAATVLQANYEDDLSLYYLGRAAEGLGYPGAAASYYRQSLRFSGSSGSCQHLSRICGGVDPPHAAGARLASIERQIYRPRRRAAPGAVRPGTAEPAGEAAPPGPETAPPWEPAPSPAVASTPSPPPEPEPTPPSPPTVAPPAPARAPAASDFIEPPPAR
jgi:hypothetical protein